jgi:hypothetical protein
MYFDGSLNLAGASAGVLLISPTGEQLKYVLQIFWKVSNNEAEYEALLHGLRLAAARPSGELSTGPLLWATSKNSSEGAKGSCTSPSSNTSQPTS